jgi:6-phosphogluconolactonase
MRHIFTALIMISLVGSVTGQGNKSSNYTMVVSPYSRTKNTTISSYNFNSTTGEATLKSTVTGVADASFVVISSDKKFVYSVNEVTPGALSAFSLNPVSGELVFLNSVPSGGNGPTNITIDKQGKYVFCANYGGGGIAAIAVNKDGSLSTNLQYFKHEPKPGGTGRQAAPHPHATVFSPDNKYLMVPDLGTDKINIYRFDGSKTSNPLEPMDPPFVNVKAGSGPRSITFHPNGKYAYSIHEMGCIVTVFDYKAGKLTEKQTTSFLADGFTGRVGGGDIRITPDGKFLYASNRGDANDLTIYKISADGKLLYIGRTPSLGTGARNFAIDPSGNFLLIANNGQNLVNIFKIDKNSGLLTPTDKKIEFVEPGCIKFVIE